MNIACGDGEEFEKVGVVHTLGNCRYIQSQTPKLDRGYDPTDRSYTQSDVRIVDIKYAYRFCI
jgi:hypothetical protein